MLKARASLWTYARTDSFSIWAPASCGVGLLRIGEKCHWYCRCLMNSAFFLFFLLHDPQKIKYTSHACWWKLPFQFHIEPGWLFLSIKSLGSHPLFSSKCLTRLYHIDGSIILDIISINKNIPIPPLLSFIADIVIGRVRVLDRLLCGVSHPGTCPPGTSGSGWTHTFY